MRSNWLSDMSEKGKGHPSPSGGLRVLTIIYHSPSLFFVLCVPLFNCKVQSQFVSLLVEVEISIVGRVGTN